MRYTNEDLERFLDDADPDQWFEVWVDLTPTEGKLGIHIRGSEYGHCHLHSKGAKMLHIPWRTNGFRNITPVNDVVKWLFASPYIA